MIQATNTTWEGGWVRFLRIGKDKYNTLIIKAKDTMNKIKKIEEDGNDDNDDDDEDNDDSNNNYYLSEKPRTRDQALNDKYILKQQMEGQVSMLAHDCDWSIYEKDNDDDSNDDGYNNNTQDVEYYKEDECEQKHKEEI